MDHVDYDIMQSYLNGGIDGSEAAAVEGHIATCSRCHIFFVALGKLSSRVGDVVKPELCEQRQGCPEDWEIASLVTGELEDNARKVVSRHISSCDNCLDRACTYFLANEDTQVRFNVPAEWSSLAAAALTDRAPTHEAAAALTDRAPTHEAAALPSETARSTTYGPRSLWNRLAGTVGEFISSLGRAPGYVVAAAAVAVFIVFLVLPEGHRAVVVSGSQSMSMREPGASFAFMGSTVPEETEHMAVRTHGGELVMEWKAVDEAKEYFLTVADADGSRVVDGRRLKTNSFSIQTKTLEEGALYAWTITGFNGGGASFEYNGKFMLVK